MRTDVVADIPPFEENSCKEEGLVSSASTAHCLSTHSSRGSLQQLSRSISLRVFPVPTSSNASEAATGSSESVGIAVVKALINKVGRGLGLSGSEKVDIEPDSTDTISAETEREVIEEEERDESRRGDVEIEIVADGVVEGKEEDEDLDGQDENSPTCPDADDLQVVFFTICLLMNVTMF